MTVKDVHIDMDELAVRIAEAFADTRRAAGVTTEAAVGILSRQPSYPGFQRAARAAVEYLAECQGRVQLVDGALSADEGTLPS